MPPMSLLTPLLNILVLSATVALAVLGWSVLDDHGGWRALDEAELWRDGRVWWTLGGLALLAGGGRGLALLVLGRPDRPWVRPLDHGDHLPMEDGSRIYVEGRSVDPSPGGVTLVWTHGWGLDRTIWSPMLERLSDFPAVTWDLPGLGRSRPGSRRAIGPVAFAQDLERILEITQGPVVLIGHSIGGMTLQSWLAQSLDRTRVAGLVLLNTTPRMPLRTMVAARLLLALEHPVLRPMMGLTIVLRPLAWIMAWQGYLSGTTHLANRLGFGRRAGRAALDYVSRLTTRNDPAAQARGNLSMFDWDSGDALARWEAPVLVIGGTHDLVTKTEASHDLAGMSPSSRLVIVPGVGHMGFLEAPEAYADAVRAFVAGLPASDAWGTAPAPNGTVWAGSAEPATPQIGVRS